MTDIDKAELRSLVVQLALSLHSSRALLSEIALSRSKFAEPAWSVFSEVVNALAAVDAVVSRDSKRATPQVRQ